MPPKRKPPGRPPSPEGRYERIQVRLPPRLARKVRRSAARGGEGLAEWMREAAERYLEARRRGEVLPPELRRRVKEAARNRGTTEAELIAEAVAAAYPLPRQREGGGGSRWGISSSGPGYRRNSPAFPVFRRPGGDFPQLRRPDGGFAPVRPPGRTRPHFGAVGVKKNPQTVRRASATLRKTTADPPSGAENPEEA